jgi:O-acetylhomoserine/O-acetylserine sulfhydrylase-like pyridoxal-dependent enzyme
VEFFVTQVAGLEQGTAAATVSGGIAATAGSVTMTDG